MSGKGYFYKVEKSALWTFIWIVVLFSFSVAIILIAPRHLDPSWTQSTSPYQVQMYEVSDPNLYISSGSVGDYDLQYVYHLINDFTLLAFIETDRVRIIAPSELEKYVTRHGESPLKLTSRLLLLRKPEQSQEKSVFNAVDAENQLRQELLAKWEKDHSDWKEKKLFKPVFEILELYDPQVAEAFSVAPPGFILENWIDENYVILDESIKKLWHQDPGVIYVNNPREYRISLFTFADEKHWRYDPDGHKIKDLEELKGHVLGFRSRKELIELGEDVYKAEGCWYCHTDQTRTLVQDVVLNGSDEYPAPPSAPNEYIYQRVTFPGTRRIGPDLSRTGVKRPSRDWHKGHFWSPKTASVGSIMPSFKHFFDDDPRGTSRAGGIGIPNYRFEAIFQYLMTKGTRITPPNQAWWIGKDPIQTIDIIEGRKKL
jgi:cytochrome c oxidase cbb3-type subunit 2